MDPNEKLLFQDPFHEVKRKRDKKKEVPAIKDPVPLKPRNSTEQPAQGIKSNTYSDRNPQRAGFVRNGEGSARNSEGSVRNRQGSARNREFPGRDSDHFVRNREGFARNWEGFARNKEGFARNSAPDSGVSRQFHVVRDNRIKHNGNRETKPPAKSSVAVPANEPKILKASEQSPAEASKDLQSPSSLPVDSLSKQVKGVGITGSERNDTSGGKKATVSNVTPPVQATKPHDSQQSSVTSSNSSVVGFYSSSSDPVHIPSLASRPAANVGAIKREVGAVGARRHTSEKSVKENSRSVPAVSKSDQSSHSNVSESAPIIYTGRAMNNSRGKITKTAQLQDKPSLATTRKDTKCEPLSRLTAKKTAPKGKAAAMDTNKPKRPASPFFVFMETFRKQFKDENPTINSVVSVGKAGGAKWKSMSESEKAPFVAEAEQRKTTRISSVQSVISNDDLLTEILLKLPVLSLVFFKSVSKQWFSLIKHAISLIKDDNLTFRRNLDPPAGLFLQKNSGYDFLSLDIRIPICRSSLLNTNFTFGPEVHGDVHILHSCNGLLLCCTSSLELYVYNPSITNMFRLIPKPDNVTYDIIFIILCFRLAFDPTKSPHYKVVYAEKVNDFSWDKVYQIHTFSSQTGNWSLCGPQFTEDGFYFFGTGVYWNDAIYWRNACRDDIFKFDIMNEPPVLTTLPTPLTLDLKVHYECRLFESRGCLLLACEEDSCSRHFTIYEKGNVYSEWSVKYIVNIDDIIKPFPESWDIYRTLYCIVLEEREEDSFLVMELDKKVVQYKIVSKTLSTISELGPNDDDDFFRCFQFIPSFAKV